MSQTLQDAFKAWFHLCSRLLAPCPADLSSISDLIRADHNAVLKLDAETPFQDAVDVVRRLLPWHVFQHPSEELDYIVSTGRSLKGKGKEKEKPLPAHLQAVALENAGKFSVHPPYPLQQLNSLPITETELALDLHRQTRALKERLREIRTREAKVSN